MFINLTDTAEMKALIAIPKEVTRMTGLKEIFLDSRNDDLPADLNPFLPKEGGAGGFLSIAFERVQL